MTARVLLIQSPPHLALRNHRDVTADLPDDTDATLVNRVLTGETDAFGELVRRHQRSVYLLCLRYLRHDDGAADMTQRVFLRGYEKLGSFRGQAAFKTWIYRIAVNLCLNTLRDRGRRGTVPLAEHHETTVPADQHRKATEAEERTQLRDAVERLPPKQRLTVILRVYHDLSFREVAEMMECSLSAAKVNYHHAMKKLREMLADKEQRGDDG